MNSKFIKKQIANRIYYLTTNIDTNNHVSLYENSSIVFEIQGDTFILLKGFDVIDKL